MQLRSSGNTGAGVSCCVRSCVSVCVCVRVYACACACAYACACACEREIESERENACVYVCVCTKKTENVFTSECVCVRKQHECAGCTDVARRLEAAVWCACERERVCVCV